MKPKILRQKPLLPTLREKKRYLVYEVLSSKAVKQEESHEIILKALKELIGNLGAGKAGVLFLKDWKNNRGILKVNNKYIDTMRASFCAISEDNLMIRSVYVSGILNKARDYL